MGAGTVIRGPEGKGIDNRIEDGQELAAIRCSTPLSQLFAVSLKLRNHSVVLFRKSWYICVFLHTTIQLLISSRA
jgi:hypothetical protein